MLINSDLCDFFIMSLAFVALLSDIRGCLKSMHRVGLYFYIKGSSPFIH